MNQLRELTRNPNLRGIAIGRCVDGTRIQDKDGCAIWVRDGYVHAHAHYQFHDKRERHLGWICLASVDDLTRTTIRHELAHIVSGVDDHLAASYRRALRELGGRLERQYLDGPRIAAKTSRRVRK